jgi:hypothetical protein
MAFARAFVRGFAGAFAGVMGRLGGSFLGPELAPAFNAGSWTATGTTPPTIDASGIHFVAASNIASGFNDSVPLKDNTEYEFVFSVSNWSTGGCRLILSGATAAHGFTGTTRTGNGTYTERGVTSGASTASTAVRVQCTGTSGNNTYDVTLVSVKEVIQG